MHGRPQLILSYRELQFVCMYANNGVDTLICNIVFIVVYLWFCIAVGVGGKSYEPVHESSGLEENFNDCS